MSEQLEVKPPEHGLTVQVWTGNRIALVCKCNGWGPVSVFDEGEADFQTLAAAGTAHLTMPPSGCEICGTLSDKHYSELCFK